MTLLVLHYIMAHQSSINAHSVSTTSKVGKPCHFGDLCTNLKCTFAHPENRTGIQCRFGERCTNVACLYTHPKPEPVTTDDDEEEEVDEYFFVEDMRESLFRCDFSDKDSSIISEEIFFDQEPIPIDIISRPTNKIIITKPDLSPYTLQNIKYGETIDY